MDPKDKDETGTEDKGVQKITLKQIEEMLTHVVEPRLDEKIDGRIASITENTQKSLDAQHKEMKEIAGLLRDAYNRNSRRRPFKAISDDAKEYIEKIWKPLMKKGGAVSPQEISDIIQRTTSTVSVEGTDEQGGFTVPEEFDRSVIQYAEENSLVWPRANVVPMRSDSKVIMKLDQTAQGTATQIDDFAGIEWYWTDEGGSKTQTKPLWKRIRLIAYKYTGLWYSSEELIADSAIDIANFVVDLFRRAFVWKTDQAFIQGTGAGQPQGVIFTPGIGTVNRTTANSFVWTDAMNMDNKLRPVFDANAIWIMRKDARNKLRDQRDSNNALILKEYYAGPMSAEGPAIQYLLGYPILVTEKVPAMGSTGDVILGNWAHYTIGNRQGFTSRVSYDFKFDEDLVSWRFVGRLDGIATIPEAFVILAESAAQS